MALEIHTFRRQVHHTFQHPLSIALQTREALLTVLAVPRSSGGAVAALLCRLWKNDPATLAAFVDAYALHGRSVTGLHDTRFVPLDAHTRVANSLFIGVTEAATGRAHAISSFASRDALLAAVAASCCVPRSFHPFDVLRSRPTYPAGEGVLLDDCNGAYVDGGITAAAPIVPAACTVTVSPLSGPTTSRPGHRISPARGTRLGALTLADLPVDLSVDNARALVHSLGASPSVLRSYFERGQRDAAAFAAQAPL